MTWNGRGSLWTGSRLSVTLVGARRKGAISRLCRRLWLRRSGGLRGRVGLVPSRLGGGDGGSGGTVAVEVFQLESRTPSESQHQSSLIEVC
jgi:hypothetical protein